MTADAFLFAASVIISLPVLLPALAFAFALVGMACCVGAIGLLKLTQIVWSHIFGWVRR